MNKFIALTKILLKTNNYLNLKDSKDMKKTYFLSFIILITVTPIFYGLLQLTMSFYEKLSSVDQYGLVLSLSFSSLSLLMFFSSIIAVMSVLYFSMDISSLLPLPYSPKALIASKFIVMLFFQYIIECFTLLPILIGFGIKNGITFYYLFYSLISLITLPMIPLSAASIIVMIIIGFTNMHKNKDQFKIVGGLFAIGISIGIYLFIQDDLGSIQSLSAIENIIALGNHSLVNLSSTLFPTTNLLTFALLNESLIENLYLLSKVMFYNLVTFIAFIVIGQLSYFKGVLGISESASKNKRISQRKMSSLSKELPIQISYMLKEVRVIIRTPAYLLNCVLGNFLWIVIIVMPYFTTDQISEQIKQVSQVFKILNTNHLLVFSAILIVFLSSTFNSIVQTSISREGTGFTVNKYLPIRYRHQIQGKILSGMFFAGINIIIIIPLLIIFFKVPIFLILVFIVTSFFSVLFISFSGLLIDLYNPKLDWSREQSAVKQNINVMIAFIPVILVSGLIVLLSFIFNLTFYMLIILIITIFIFFDTLLYQLLMHQGLKLYEKVY